MRDRLIELIEKAKKQECLNAMCGDIDSLIDSPRGVEFIADFLLANGVIVPPCKVGDVVYYFSHRPFCLSMLPNTIYEAKVVRIVTNSLGTSLIIQIRNEYGTTEVPDIRSWGISVFATREEAEQALSLNSSKEVIL